MGTGDKVYFAGVPTKVTWNIIFENAKRLYNIGVE
jgi:hypothetical protein